MIEDKQIYFFRVGKAQYLYGKNSSNEQPYYCMKYYDKFAIDTGRAIHECLFPGPPKSEYHFFNTEDDLFMFLDGVAADNLDRIMWPLTPSNWVTVSPMTKPAGYNSLNKSCKQ